MRQTREGERRVLREKTLFIMVTALLAAAFILSVCVGKYPIALEDIAGLISGGEVAEMTRRVFFNLRLPRTLMALMAGLALGMAGNVYQTIFKNPLAAPDVIGVANGANLGAACAIVLLGGGTAAIAAAAFLGGMLAVGLVMLLVRVTNNHSTATYVLAGIVLSSLSQALIMILKFFADPEKELAAMEFWAMGSFGNVTAAKLLTVLPFFCLGMAGLILFRRQIELLSLNEDEARMLGLRLKPVRMLVLAASTLTVASIISVTGLIVFIGLIAPHIARLALGRNGFITSALSALTGAVVLLLADCLARTLYSAELPISILTTFIGVPFLIYFMCHKKEGRL